MSVTDGDTKESSTVMFDGDKNKDFITFEKSIGRWCRSKYGTSIGDKLWRNEMPVLAGMGYAEQVAHFQEVWEGIDATNSTRAKHLYDNPAFWTNAWHEKWRIGAWDRIFDYVDGKTDGQASMEVTDVGMSKASTLRRHLTKQFGGSGEDVRARELRFQNGMPRSQGEAPFYPGVNTQNKLRELAAERTALWKMCAEDKRALYEWGKEVSLVKIVMKYIRGTEYEPCVEALLQEIKIQKQVAKSVPTVNAAGTGLVMPDASTMELSTDDWEFRNYSDAWLPSWDQLRTKLVSTYKTIEFRKEESLQSSGGQAVGGKNNNNQRKLPTMLVKEVRSAVREAVAMIVPGFGTAPVPMRDSRPPMECWNCGKTGHKSFECPAPKKEGGNKGKAKRSWDKKKGVDGMSTQKSDEVCRAFRDTGRCRWGEKCKFVHVDRSAEKTPIKKFNLTKRQRKEITAAAVQTIKAASKGGDGNQYDDGELEGYLKSFW